MTPCWTPDHYGSTIMEIHWLLQVACGVVGFGWGYFYCKVRGQKGNNDAG